MVFLLRYAWSNIYNFQKAEYAENNVISANNDVNFQNYEFVAERAELLYVNDKFIKNVYFHFGKVNRTFLAVNTSFDIVRDVTNRKLLVTTEH